MRNPFSKVCNPGEFSTPPGDPIHHICTGRFNGRTLSVVETGTEDIQQSIQSHAPFTDLRFMLSRLSVGDESVLSSHQPMYGDFSGLFDNPVDAINAVNDARSRFDQLSSEEKKACNNDWRVWFASLLHNFSASDPADPSVGILPNSSEIVKSASSVTSPVSPVTPVVKDGANEP